MAKYESLKSGIIIGTRDCSADLLSIEPKFSRTLHDSTTLADANKREVPGLFECSYSAEAFFDDTSGIVQQLTTNGIMAAFGGTGITTVFPGNATNIGALGVVLPDGLLKEVGESIKVNSLVMINFTMQGSGKPGLRARLLHPIGTESTTGASASHDRTSSTANGGMANLHVTGVTGSNPATIKVQHSVDNSTWVDLITFASVAAAGSQSLQVAGTINRYIRASFTIGATSSDTFLVAFSGF